MRFLILDTYYLAFLHSFYARHPDLSHRPYAEQWRILMDQCFGTADFYSANLKKLGHDAHEVVANCETLQRQWARENALHLWAAYPICRCLRRVKAWQLAVLQAQVEQLRPDVLYVQDMNWTDATLLKSVKAKTRLVVGQTAYALRCGLDLQPYDVVITSFPHYVDSFRSQGLHSQYLRFAFDERVLDRLDVHNPTYNVTFVGGFSPQHSQGTAIFEQLAQEIPVKFWGYGVENLPKNSLVRRYHCGQAWGIEMFRILSESRVTLNRHIDVAQSYANNMRLFDATGVGTCLVTDLKDNLHELFEPDREVVAYTCAEDCVEKVRYLLEHENERAAIAKSGQRRTLREHTYDQRMQEFVGIVRKYL